MDITTLKQQAITIRDEQERSANTASRVGRAMLETVNAIEENATSITANAANIKTNATNIATNASDISKIQAFYRGDLGNFASWTEATAALDAMVTAPSANGQYQIRIGSVPFIVNFACLSTGSKIYTQSVIGAAALRSDGTLVTTHGQAVNIFSRSYADSTWGAWTRLAAMSDVPTPQVGTEGYEGKYIFSHQSDNDRKVLSGIYKVISVNTGVEIQHRVWGATAYTDATTSKAQIPIVNPSQYGVMNKDVFKRLLYHTHYESGSTTNAVNINYTNYESGGISTLTLTAASSAKAGVMTSAMFNSLTELGNYYKGKLGTNYTTTADFRTALDGMPTNQMGKYGRYRTFVNNILVYVTFVQLSSTDHSYAQWIEGPVIKGAGGNIYLNNELGVHIIGRVYANGAWGNWRSTILDDELPIPASATNDGLMSKEDYALLQQIKTQLNL